MNRHPIIAQCDNEFVNVFVLGVTRHPYEDKLVARMQDKNGNMIVVKCNSI